MCEEKNADSLVCNLKVLTDARPAPASPEMSVFGWWGLTVAEILRLPPIFKHTYGHHSQMMLLSLC